MAAQGKNAKVKKRSQGRRRRQTTDGRSPPNTGGGNARVGDGPRWSRTSPLQESGGDTRLARPDSMGKYGVSVMRKSPQLRGHFCPLILSNFIKGSKPVCDGQRRRPGLCSGRETRAETGAGPQVESGPSSVHPGLLARALLVTNGFHINLDEARVRFMQRPSFHLATRPSTDSWLLRWGQAWILNRDARRPGMGSGHGQDYEYLYMFEVSGTKYSTAPQPSRMAHGAAAC